MAERGGQPGNKHAGNPRMARKALERALELRSPVDRYRTLVEIWDRVIQSALDGDNQAANMIVDRLDGKPAQEILGMENSAPPTIVMQMPEGFKPE